MSTDTALGCQTFHHGNRPFRARGTRQHRVDRDTRTRQDFGQTPRQTLQRRFTDAVMHHFGRDIQSRFTRNKLNPPPATLFHSLRIVACQPDPTHEVDVKILIPGGIIDIRSGRVSFTIDVTPPLMPHINSGALRPLAVTSAERIPSLPQVPTLAEAALPGYEIFTWDGIFAPKGTPADRLDILHAGVQKSITDPAFIKTMEERGTVLQLMPRKEFGDLVKKEYDRMGALARSLGVTID